MTTPPPSRRRTALLLLASLALVLGVAACAKKGGGSTGGLPEASTDAGARGRALVEQNHCTTCHTTDGSRSTAPTWQGLAGSKVALADGTTVTAGRAYLTRAVQDPRADTVDGFANIMPTYGFLTDAEVADIVTYLQELPAS